MKLSTFSFETTGGWSVKEFPAMDSAHTLLMVFASPEYLDQPYALQELMDAFPTAKVIGCSTAGEIIGTWVNDTSLSVAVLQFERSKVEVVSAEIKHPGESFSVGTNLARHLNSDDLSAIFVLSDGLHVNGSELVKGLNSALSKEIIITGGLAGDGDRFERTWVIRNRQPESGVVTAVGFYGKHLNISHGSQGGWNNFGPERHITRSEGNVLYELDGKSALVLYQEYLGERASGLPATGLLFPLSIRQDKNDNRQLVRTLLAVNETKQSMTFAGDIPQGYLAQLMRTNFDHLINSAGNAANQAKQGVATNEPLLAVAVSCFGRRMVLGERIEEEIEMTLKHLPVDCEQVGFYSYGEIAPHATGAGACDFHNQTMTLTTFSEN